MNKKILSGLSICFLLNCSHAGIGSASYQKLGMDARGIAIGRTASCTSNGASSIFWNPANLCLNNLNKKEKFDFMLTYMRYPEFDIQYLTSALAYRKNKFGIGIGYMQYGVEDIHKYDNQMNYLGSFQNTEESVLLGLACKIPYVMNIGVTIQGLTQDFDYGKLNNKKDWAIGFRAGIIFFPIYSYERLMLSLVLNNRSILSEDEMRPTTTAGIFWSSKMNKKEYLKQLILATEIEQENTFPIKLKFGAELFAAEFENFCLFIRGGVDDIILETRDDLICEDVRKDITVRRLNQLNLKITWGSGLEFPALKLSRKSMRIRFDFALVNEAYRNLGFYTIGFYW